MNFHSDDWINTRLNQHFDYATKRILNRNIIGIFLHGSQNYGLDFETSDVDTVCLVMPNKDDILTACEPLSKELIMPETNEKIVIWEIRKFINFLEKGGFNQLEILYTNYYIVNDIYKDFWTYIKNHQSEFVYLNSCRTANSFCGMINRCVKEIKKPNTNYLKEYMRVLFFEQLLVGYLYREPFDKILNPPNSDAIKEFRSNSAITRSDVIVSSEGILNDCKSLINNYEFENTNKYIISDIRNELFKHINFNGG